MNGRRLASVCARCQSARILLQSLAAGKSQARTERIAACRNRYLDELRYDRQYADVDYVMVVDLDGVNNDLRAEAVATCWASACPWDVVTANQSDAYYDIWALRHPDWCPVDCYDQYARLRAMFGHPRALAIDFIRGWHGWIEERTGSK